METMQAPTGESRFSARVLKAGAAMLVVGVLRAALVAGVRQVAPGFFATEGVGEALDVISLLLLWIPGSRVGVWTRRSTGRGYYGLVGGLAVGAVGGCMAGFLSVALLLADPRLWLLLSYGGALPASGAETPGWAFMMYFTPYAIIGAIAGFTGALRARYQI